MPPGAPDVGPAAPGEPWGGGQNQVARADDDVVEAMLLEGLRGDRSDAILAVAQLLTRSS
jgi:hypothetical protein